MALRGQARVQAGGDAVAMSRPEERSRRNRRRGCPLTPPGLTGIRLQNGGSVEEVHDADEEARSVAYPAEGRRLHIGILRWRGKELRPPRRLGKLEKEVFFLSERVAGR